jgi:methyl-accepting chemotaxis protein
MEMIRLGVQNFSKSLDEIQQRTNMLAQSSENIKTSLDKLNVSSRKVNDVAKEMGSETIRALTAVTTIKRLSTEVDSGMAEIGVGTTEISHAFNKVNENATKVSQITRVINGIVHTFKI